VLLLTWAIAAGLAALLVQEEAGEVLDSALTEVAQQLMVLPDAAFLAIDGSPRSDIGDDKVPAGFAPHQEFLIYQIFDGQGRLLTRSHQAPLKALAAQASLGFTEQEGWRTLSLQKSDGRRRVVVAESLAHRQEVLWESSLGLLLPLFLLLPLAALGLHWVLRSGFAALLPIQQALAAPSTGQTPVAALTLQGMPNELLPLLRAVNDMRARLNNQVAIERNFASQMAHDLRTPLAAARANAQRLVAGTNPAQQPQYAQALLRQIDSVTALASRLLQLARVDAGLALRREAVDLKLLARLVLEDYQSAQRPGQISLQTSEESCVVQADLDALGIALRNLVDNALRHAGAAGSIEVVVTPMGLSVRDHGPPIDPTTLRQMQMGDHQAKGSGLGLPMVRRIAEQSGARLELSTFPAPDSGLLAALQFAPDVRSAGSLSS
jgi:two-component system OmpR family sensor kinase